MEEGKKVISSILLVQVQLLSFKLSLQDFAGGTEKRNRTVAARTSIVDAPARFRLCHSSVFVDVLPTQLPQKGSLC